MPPKSNKYRPPPKRPTTRTKLLGYMGRAIRQNMKRLSNGRHNRSQKFK